MYVTDALQNAKKTVWRHPDLAKRRFRLTVDGRDLVFLEFEKMFGSLAVATIGENTYTLKRQGFLRPQATLRRQGDDQDLAVLHVSFGGAARVESGRQQYQLITKSFWQSKWAIQETDGRELYVADHHGFSAYEAELTFSERAWQVQDLLPLVLLPWYSAVLMNDETAMAAAVSAAT
jgi:hypothetical protein